MNRQLGFISINMGAVIWFFVILGVSFGAFLMWMLPVVWSWVKPILHQLTA